MHDVNRQNTILAILGPTASGKSALAFNIAKEINAEIISADSRQIYRELNIGSAKPSPETLREIKHHFINELSIGDPFTAGDFARQASKRIHSILQSGKNAIIAGGSTLYLEALLYGFADLPPSDTEKRKQLAIELETLGSRHLFERLRKLDPQQAATLDHTKTHRMVRSLEIIELSGLTVSEMQKKHIQPLAGINVITCGLSLPRPLLYERINQRTDQMLASGLLQEAKSLFTKYSPCGDVITTNALQTVGYQELFAYLDGKTDFMRAITLIKQHTRNYAKRQLTFFKNRLNVNWVEAPDNEHELSVLTASCCRMITEN
ncbi:MAG: tRNA (adenosine(37)-N6)-dimethylallyltransferase MiaA [Chlorobiaceae bacterium]|nr:tRNA (adenosine(37)-N6)-dimethylallyltransferase MiaA [Chlorobiaceae bacterium]NTW62573.1 tRNA (adenosine(37)-N6)-dimethylallyltransferase MiaA [Chlorobiaceae bacterium]